MSQIDATSATDADATYSTYGVYEKKTNAHNLMILNGAKVWTNYVENGETLSSYDTGLICKIKSDLAAKLLKHSITVIQERDKLECPDTVKMQDGVTSI